MFEGSHSSCLWVLCQELMRDVVLGGGTAFPAEAGVNISCRPRTADAHDARPFDGWSWWRPATWCGIKEDGPLRAAADDASVTPFVAGGVDRVWRRSAYLCLLMLVLASLVHVSSPVRRHCGHTGLCSYVTAFWILSSLRRLATSGHVMLAFLILYAVWIVFAIRWPLLDDAGHAGPIWDTTRVVYVWACISSAGDWDAAPGGFLLCRHRMVKMPYAHAQCLYIVV